MNNLDLIEQLEDLKYHCQDFAEDEMEKEIQPFTDDVKALDQAINELRWIPVDEKLPDKDGDYLVQLQIDARGKEIYFMQVSFTRFDDGDTEWLYNSFYNAFKNVDPFVIAWRPLPKPYEKK